MAVRVPRYRYNQCTVGARNFCCMRKIGGHNRFTNEGSVNDYAGGYGGGAYDSYS